MNLSTLLVLVFLVGMWAALLVGPVLQRRGGRTFRTSDSVGSFQRQLSVLDRNRGLRSAAHRPAPLVSGRGPVPAGRLVGSSMNSRARLAEQRRRRIVIVLGACTLSFLLLSLLKGGMFVLLFGLAAALLVGYLGLVFRLLGTQAEREMKVAFLPHRAPAAARVPVTPLRQVSGGRR